MSNSNMIVKCEVRNFGAKRCAMEKACRLDPEAECIGVNA